MENVKVWNQSILKSKSPLKRQNPLSELQWWIDMLKIEHIQTEF